jgi:hypothetical protein
MHKLGYHASYFEAIAYWELGNTQFKNASDNGKGMGMCVAYLKIALSKLQSAEQNVKGAGSNYVSNWQVKMNEVGALMKKADEENRSIFYEKEPGPNEIEKPDPKNFVKMED